MRVCDIGGWTDTWFAKRGAVFNIAVRPFVEVQITAFPRTSDDRVNLNLENYGDKYSINPDKVSYDRHPLIEATVDVMEIPEDLSVEINLFSKAPSGASVGTSAAVSVALIAALDALTPGVLTASQITAEAHRVETEKLGLQSGVQDQLAAAYGGLNFIRIDPYPQSEVSPLKVSDNVLWELENRLALVYIGKPHSSSDVHKKVIADLGDEASEDERIDGLRTLAVEAKEAICAGDLERLGRVMNRNTDFQRLLHRDLVCDGFEEIIDIAGRYHALGCKVNGAGGDGGSITVLSDGDVTKKREMIRVLENKGYHSIPLGLSSYGVRVWDATT